MKLHMCRLTRTLGVAAGLPVLLISAPSIAVADENGDGATSLAYPQSNYGEVENYFSEEACTPYSKFKFRFYFKSKLGGAFRNVGYTHMNLGASLLPYDSQPLTFCKSTGDGSGQGVKNGAASARNYHATYKGHVFSNSSWKGAVDITAPGTYFNKLTHTYNDNASFAWRS
ncbi:hypothetical protein [Streptomyces sp. NPDC054863]